MKTLLDKALSEPRRIKPAITDEELELVIALVNGDISITQAGRAIGRTGRPSMYLAYRCFACIRDAIAAGQIARIKRIHTKNGK